MALTRQQFIDWAKARGWESDAFGHLQKSYTRIGNTHADRHRYKLTRLLVRLEFRSGERWIRLKSGYFGKMSINAHGQLEGMTR